MGSTVRFAGLPMFFVSALPPLMPGLPNCWRNLPSLELQELSVLVAAAGEPDDVFLIDEDAVLGLWPVVARSRSAPGMDQRAGLIEFEHWRSRNAALRFLRRVTSAGKALVAADR